MDNVKIKVEQVLIGKFDCDCMFTTIDKKSIQICFSKDDNIAQYEGQEITLAQVNGIYSVITDARKK